jgi:hypothetical protein
MRPGARTDPNHTHREEPVMGKASDFFFGSPEQREHNATFNNSSTDPDSDEYLASHDRVIEAEKAAKDGR